MTLNDALQDEIQTLQDVYTTEELTISITTTLKIAYIANINDDIQIIIEFTINISNVQEHNIIISVQNGAKSNKKLAKTLLTKIETILHEKYKEEQDSMPIFQCISYCSNELINEEIFNETDDVNNDKKENNEPVEMKIRELAINQEPRQYLCKPNKIRTRIGIVGLPNIGKSSFFNLISSKKVAAENYPFCTIKPSQAQVIVSCQGFTDLCTAMNKRNANANHIGPTLTIYDIAGLVRGAHEGKGLGNEFLSNIQSVGAIYHMVRAFDIKRKTNEKPIQHVEGSVDTIRDLNIISYELRQKDLNVMKNKLLSLMRKLRHVNKTLNSELKNEYKLVDKIINLLSTGFDIGCQHSWSEKDIEYIHSYNLFSCKPAVFLVNVSEDDWINGKGINNKWINDVNEWVEKYYPGSRVLPFCAKYEKKQPTNKNNCVVNDIIYAGYESLQLIHFYTINDNYNVKCWTIRKGMKAHTAARKINFAIEKNFICVETYSYADFKQCDYNLAKVKANGKYTKNGKKYIIQHQDILYFKWNKGNKKSKK